MIKETDVFRIGKLIKPHGIKGEISFSFDNDIFDKVECPYVVCLIDDIFVPFFLKDYRFKGKETALLTFEDIDSEEKAKRMSGLPVFFPREYFEEENEEVDYSWSYFIGFKVIDTSFGEVGVVDAVDESTINTLFLIKDLNDEDIIIPAAEDFIAGVDNENKILHLKLPEGLLE